MTDRTVRVLLAATDLIRVPSFWSALRADHVPDRDGRCLACRPTRDGRPPWPCFVRRLADRAWAAQRHGGATR